MIEIDCPEFHYNDGNYAYRSCKVCNNTGKIKVYTEAELQEAVKKEREACALVCDDIHNKSPSNSMLVYWCGEQIRERSNI